MRRSRLAFTLIEALAAIVVLAMLATATVPLAQRLASGSTELEERCEARALLRRMLARGGPPADQVGPSDHAGWHITMTTLAPGEEVPPTAGLIPGITPAHTWVHIRILATSGAVLADAVTVGMSPP